MIQPNLNFSVIAFHRAYHHRLVKCEVMPRSKSAIKKESEYYQKRDPATATP